MAEDKIDENILPLVNYINGLIGLYTDHSCGGHENPKSWQENEGEFYVCFRTKHEPPTKSEWANIRFLVTKAWNFTQGNSCERKTRVEIRV